MLTALSYLLDLVTLAAVAYSLLVVLLMVVAVARHARKVVAWDRAGRVGEPPWL